MDLMDLMSTRRSVRMYEAKPVDDELVGRILAAGMLSPSGRAKKPWELIVVNDRALIDQLADCRTMGSQMLRGASVAIVVVADAEYSDTWIEDCSLVMGNMHLMAHSLGLGSCWIQCRGRQAKDDRPTDTFIKDLLNIPEKLSVEALLSIGWPKDMPEPHNMEELPFEKVHLNSF